MIYQIDIGKTTYFKEFDDKRHAKEWAAEKAQIIIQTATPEAMLRHFQSDEPSANDEALNLRAKSANDEALTLCAKSA